MKTRKEIGDQRGTKSIYVVEINWGGGVEWIATHKTNKEYGQAVALKNNYYRELKEWRSNKITKEMFRVALYVRTE